MKKIMQGKMDKKAFWITVVVSWLLIIMLAVNLSTGDWLGDIGRGAVGIIALVIYFAACAMRLRDAGKSVGLMLIMCIVPLYAFVIGCYESEESQETDVENEEKETMQNEAGEGYKVEQELIKKYETILPNELLEIWKNSGFTDLLDGYLRLINPEEYQDLLAETFFKGKSSIPILTTAFGDIIAVEEDQYIVIVRYKYGSFNILAKDFKRFAQNLEENYFLEKYFQIPQYMEAVNRLGKLEHDECFGYVPLLGLGGSEKVENLKKVKIKEHIEIISQLVGKIGKVFEDYFTEIQADMISICMEYVESRAEKIYIYCSYEDNTISGNYFYKINEKVVHKNRLNDALISGQKEYDVSADRQNKVLDIIFDDIKALMKLCQDYGKNMPTQMKLIYDVSENKMHAEYEYDEVYSNDPNKTAYDVLEEWYEFERNNS